MSEWIVNGNKPQNPDFTGELTERQQELVDLYEAQERLKPFLSVACRNCVLAQVEVINHEAYKVIKGEKTKLDAMTSVMGATIGCAGPRVDERYYDAELICPRREEEDAKRKGNCF